MLRTSLLPGLVKAAAAQPRPPVHRRRALRDRPRLPAAARRASSCPTSASTSACSSPAARRPPRSRCGRCWPTCCGSRRPSVVQRRSARAPPGPQRAGDGRRRRGRRGRRDRPRRARGLRHRRAGRLRRARPRARCCDGPRRPDAHRPVSRFPSSDIDLAFEVPDEVERHRPRAHAWPAPTRWCGRCGCSTSTGAPRSARAAAAWPTASASRPRTAPSPTTRWRPTRTALVAAAEAAHGVTLRG